MDYHLYVVWFSDLHCGLRQSEICHRRFLPHTWGYHYLNQIRYKRIHFAWDRADEDLRPALTNARKWLKKCCKQNTSVYILVNNGESFENAVARVEFIKSLRMQPYVMIYRKPTAPKELIKLARYANNPFVCWSTPTFADYKGCVRKEKINEHC